MIECGITKKEYATKYMTKTTDGHWVNFDIYKHITFDAKKGALTLQECRYWYFFNKRFNAAFRNFLSKIRDETGEIIGTSGKRKFWAEKNYSVESLREFLRIENDYFLINSKKTLDCVNKEDALTFLEVMENYPFDDTNRMIPNGKEMDALSDEYIKNHTGVHFYFL